MGVAREDSFGYHGWCRSLDDGMGYPPPQSSSGCRSERHLGRIQRPFCETREGGLDASQRSSCVA